MKLNIWSYCNMSGRPALFKSTHLACIYNKIECKFIYSPNGPFQAAATLGNTRWVRCETWPTLRRQQTFNNIEYEYLLIMVTVWTQMNKSKEFEDFNLFYLFKSDIFPKLSQNGSLCRIFTIPRRSRQSGVIWTKHTYLHINKIFAGCHYFTFSIT